MTINGEKKKLPVTFSAVSSKLISTCPSSYWHYKDNRDLSIATACTELPLAYAATGFPLDRQISSLQALADACLDLLYGREDAAAGWGVGAFVPR